MDAMSTLTIDDLTYERVAKTIDHSLLRPELTLDEVREGCAIAARYHVASVCARPADVVAVRGAPRRDGRRGRDGHRLPARVEQDAGQGLRVDPRARRRRDRARHGHQHRLAAVRRWTPRSRPTSGPSSTRVAGRAIVKVILENAYLTKDEIVRGCQAVEAAGADYVKTSTGFAPSGATLDDLRLMRASVSPRVKVKAAGGVRTLDALIEVMDAGADRSRRDEDGRDARRVRGPQGRRGGSTRAEARHAPRPRPPRRRPAPRRSRRPAGPSSARRARSRSGGHQRRPLARRPRGAGP